jgi:hypothetical protein
VQELSGQVEIENSRHASISTASVSSPSFDAEGNQPRKKWDEDTKIPSTDFGGSISNPQENIWETQIDEDFGTLVIESSGEQSQLTGSSKSQVPKYRYVNHSFWAKLSEEVGRSQILLPRLFQLELILLQGERYP